MSHSEPSPEFYDQGRVIYDLVADLRVRMLWGVA